MATLVRFELLKTFRKWRTFIGFVAVGLFFENVVGLLNAVRANLRVKARNQQTRLG